MWARQKKDDCAYVFQLKIMRLVCCSSKINETIFTHYLFPLNNLLS